MLFHYISRLKQYLKQALTTQRKYTLYVLGRIMAACTSVLIEMTYEFRAVNKPLVCCVLLFDLVCCVLLFDWTIVRYFAEAKCSGIKVRC